jgi:hypothetical protein
VHNLSTETLKLLFQSKTQGFLIVKPLSIIYHWTKKKKLHQEHGCCRKITNVSETQDGGRKKKLHSGPQKQETSKTLL